MYKIKDKKQKLDKINSFPIVSRGEASDIIEEVYRQGIEDNKKRIKKFKKNSSKFKSCPCCNADLY